MAITPDAPFPKSKGDEIRAKDWNDMVVEVQRLDLDKVGTEGGKLIGELTIDGSLGLGTDDPQDKLDVHGAICFNSDTNRRVYGAARNGRDAVVLDGHWDELEVKGRVIDWSGQTLYIGYDNAHPNDDVRIGGKARGVVLHSGGAWDYTLCARSTRVGIGTASPETKLNVVGDRIRLRKPNSSLRLDMSTHGSALDIVSHGADLYINNGTSRKVRVRNFVNISTRECKHDISKLSSEVAQQALVGLEPVAFKFNDDEPGERQYGFISEDTPDVLATADKKGVNPMAIAAVLTRIVKEQQQTIDELRGEVESLKSKLARDAHD